MEQIHLTISHWVFLLVILSIFISIGFRKGVIIPSIIGIFILALTSYQKNDGLLNMIIFSIQVIFKSFLNAGNELFDIILVIAMMASMLKALQAQGAADLMVSPMKKIMIGPKSAFFALSLTMYIAAVFFWPTPAIALVGTVLIPVAIRMGLPAIACAVAVNLSGHGMALAADPIIQGATRLTASSAGIEAHELLPYTILFSLICGSVAIAIAIFTLSRDMRSGKIKTEKHVPDELIHIHGKDAQEEEILQPYARIFAVLVPVVLVSVAALMVYRGIFTPDQAIRGSDATSLLGGTATILMVLSTCASKGTVALDEVAIHTRDGFFFAMKIFGPIIPIAGFFLLGNPEYAGKVIGEGTPGFLFDIGYYIAQGLTEDKWILGVGTTAIGMLTGMDGSGFSGLPLVGSLAGALASGANLNVAVLAALGQVSAIFTGGGTLVAWAFGACADAGVANVAPIDLVRRNFIPVLSGIITITIVAIFMM